MKLLFSLLAKLCGRNFNFTSKEVIVDQLNEPRALPMGRTEFQKWANRIIMGALVPNDEGFYVGQDITRLTWIDVEGRIERLQIFEDSQKFALANLLLHLGPTESHKPDAFFIHSLRKFAVNQVADAIRVELRDAAKARTAKDEKARGEVQGAAEVLVQSA